MDSQKEMSAINDFPIGSIVFEKYEVLNFIASGAGGRVYRVLDTLRRVEVALKVIPSESFDEKQLMRFQTEAQTSAKLCHANIATVFDFGLIDGTPYLVMEFVDGLSLEEMLAENKQLNLGDFVDLFIQITEAIIHAHNNGVIHRDIKPGNVVIHTNADGVMTAKILDFGVAKRIDTGAGNTGRQTPTGNIVGSPLYMSPEQAQGGKVTPRSDYYSIGSMMFRCLAGYPPIQAATAIETIMKVANSKPPSLSEQLGVDVPSELCELVDGLLSKDPTQRPSLEEVVLPLLRALSQTIAELDEEADPPGTTSDTTEVTPKRSVSSVKVVVFANLVFIVCVFAICLWTTFGRKEWEHQSKPMVVPDFSKSMPAIRSAELVQQDESSVNLNGGSVTDQELPKHVKHPLNGIRKLEASGTELRTLETINQFKNLEELQIAKNHLNDGALERLTSLKHLKILDIRDMSNITDKDMDTIAKLTTLASLDLTRLQNITPAGLKKLITLTGLQQLKLQDTPFSPSEIEQFAPSINPCCTIELTGCPRIKLDDLKTLKLKFPDLKFTSEVHPFFDARSVVDDLSVPLDDIFKQVSKTEGKATGAQKQKLKKVYQGIINIVEKRYGKETPRSRNYYIHMANAFADVGDAEFNANWRIVAYQTAADKAKKAGDAVCELAALDQLINCMSEHRGYQAGKATALRAIALAESRNEQSSSDQVDRISAFALKAKLSSQFKDSETYYKRALAIQDKFLGKETGRAAVLVGGLGDCYLMTETYSKANACFKRVIETFKKLGGTSNESEHNAFLMACVHRARMIMMNEQPGSLAEAKELNRESYRLSKKPGTPIDFAISAVRQRAELLTMLKAKPSEIEAVRKEETKLLEKAKRQTQI